jgi:hypothetical protein
VVFARRLGATLGTTLFALLQSLLYQYPDHWIEVSRRLRIKEAGIPNDPVAVDHASSRLDPPEG